MSLRLVKEDGSGLADANSYASLADGDAYHEGHLYASVWTEALPDTRATALVMATRLVDAYMRFGGSKSTAAQALQWPRGGCPDPDSAGVPLSLRASVGGGACFNGNAVPAVVVAATCEMARELLVADRTTAPLGEGLKSSKVGDSVMVFDAAGRAPVLSRVAIALLGKVGVYLGNGAAMVTLQRA